VVLLSTDANALWVSSWPYADWAFHEWAGAWICTTFRNEGSSLSSILVAEAVAATRAIWGKPPDLGMVTFINTARVRPKAHPGYCFRRAGFREAGVTKKDKLVALQMLPAEMPDPELPIGATYTLSGVAEFERPTHDPNRAATAPAAANNSCDAAQEDDRQLRLGEVP
jgi:hypothetical protein